MASKEVCINEGINECCMTDPLDNIVSQSLLSFDEVSSFTNAQTSHPFSSDNNFGQIERSALENSFNDLADEQIEFLTKVHTLEQDCDQIDKVILEKVLYCNIITPVSVATSIDSVNDNVSLENRTKPICDFLDSNNVTNVTKINLSFSDDEMNDQMVSFNDEALCSDQQISEHLISLDCGTISSDAFTLETHQDCSYLDCGTISSDAFTLETHQDCSYLNVNEIESDIENVVENILLQAAADGEFQEGEIGCFDKSIEEEHNLSCCDSVQKLKIGESDEVGCYNSGIIHSDEFTQRIICERYETIKCCDHDILIDLDMSTIPVYNDVVAVKDQLLFDASFESNNEQCTFLELKENTENVNATISPSEKTVSFYLSNDEDSDIEIEKKMFNILPSLMTTNDCDQDVLVELLSAEACNQSGLNIPLQCGATVKDIRDNEDMLHEEICLIDEDPDMPLTEKQSLEPVMFVASIEESRKQNILNISKLEENSSEDIRIDLSLLVNEISDEMGAKETYQTDTSSDNSDENDNTEKLSESNCTKIDNQNSNISSSIENIFEEENDSDFSEILNSGSPMLRRARNNDNEKRKDCRHIFEQPAEEISDQTSEERQQYRSLRDSLDFVKQERLISEASENDMEKGSNFEKSSGESLEDCLNDRDKLPHLCQSLSDKKKASLSANRDSIKGRRVSFPEEEEKLITSYLEPVNPWSYMNNVTNDVISEAYQTSCRNYNARILPQVVQQIAALPIDAGSRIERLSLKNCKLDASQVECLEEIFRRVQFKVLDFEECELDDDTSIPLLDMIEFYDSTTHLNISSNTKIGSRGWQACARMLKRTPSLRILDARNTNLNEQNMPLLCRALRLGTRLSTLHLENCNLTGRPLVNLAGALRLNDTITDLYLADNRLGINDCIQIGNVVRSNKILKLLDLRNNNIQDTGCSHICKDITEQQNLLKHSLSHVEGKETKIGITTLNLWNNYLTVNSIPSFSSMLCVNFTLETLNLGRNCITSEGILLLKTSLMRNKSLKRLGLQATRIGNEGVVALAECIADNSIIERIDLRENSIQVAGLMALSRSLHMSSSVVQVDLDFNPRAEPTPDLSNQHVNLQQEIKSLCSNNLTNAHTKGNNVPSKVEHEETHDSCISPELRKISLTCEISSTNIIDEETRPNLKLGWSATETKRYRSPEPSPCPSPSLSPSPSPVPSPMRNRFKVFKVTEDLGYNGFSTSAPASISLFHSMSGSLPSLVAAGTAPNRFMTGKRFTVTKVTDVSIPFKSSLPSNRAMSSPSLITPIEDLKEGPTIVVSSPNKAVRGFSIDDADTDITSMKGDFDPIYIKERSNSIDFNTSKSLNLESPSFDDVFESSSSSDARPLANPTAERKHVVYGPPADCILPKAPLASIEAGSFDSDSEDSENTTQSSDLTHSDEINVSNVEQHMCPKLAWTDDTSKLGEITTGDET